jgi:4-amino-4-deoxy-L-arabinose transferase-like glycosyltransferase
MIRRLPIILILLLAAFLRLRGLGHDSIWGDESATVWLARMPIDHLIPVGIENDQTPPLHHLVVHCFIKFFGLSETVVRMPSALAGIAGVAVMYDLVRRLLGRRVAVGAALLLAVAPMHVEYSRECRAYALLAFLSLASCDLFVRIVRNRRPTQTLLAGYVLVSVAMMYTHVYGCFTLLAQDVVFAGLLLGRRSRRHVLQKLRTGLAAQLAIVLLFSPWIPNVLKWTRMVRTSFWVITFGRDDVVRTFWMLTGSAAALFAITALVVIAIWLHGRSQWRRRRWRRAFGFGLLLAMAFVPTFVPMTASMLSKPIFVPRYAILASAGLCGVAAAAIMMMRPAALRVVALVVLATVVSVGTAPKIDRAPWRLVGDFLNQNMRPGDLAVIHSRVGTRVYDFYVNRPDVPRRGVDAPAVPVSLPMDGRRVWLIMWDYAYTAQEMMGRAPWRIERRIMVPGVLAMELTDEPEPPPPSTATPPPTSSRSE